MAADLVRKLGYRGGPALVVNPPPGYDLEVEAPGSQDAPLNFVQVFVTSAAELRAAVPALFGKAAGDPVFWVTYPKQASGVASELNRDVIARMIADETTFRVVSNVSVDATWSALRLRRKTLVRSHD